MLQRFVGVYYLYSDHTIPYYDEIYMLLYICHDDNYISILLRCRRY